MVRESGAKTFETLDVYRVALDFAEMIYRITARFPAEERYGLTSQLRRAAVSIPTNIAEGWGRGHGADNVRFVRIARGSSHECLALLQISERLGLLPQEDLVHALDLQTRVGKLVQAYHSALERNLVREDLAPYDPDRIADSE